MEDIEVEIVKSKMPKWKKLKEIDAEIKKMIENNITIDKQIELILKNNILEKIDRKEYTNIIKKHFGYVGRNQKKSVAATQPVTTQKVTTGKDEKKSKSIEETLSEDVDLMSIHLQKKAEGRN